jgi:hypothetical protein
MAEHGALTAAIEATGYVPIPRRAAIRNSQIAVLVCPVICVRLLFSIGEISVAQRSIHCRA